MNTIELCELCQRYALELKTAPDGRKVCEKCLDRFCPICDGLKEPHNATCTDSYCQEASTFYNIARCSRKNSPAQRSALERARTKRLGT